MAGNRFQLAGLTDPGERVPYTLSLAGGGDPVALPSADGLSLTLGKSGTTCLTPTLQGMGRRGCQGISAMCLRSPLSPALGAALVAALCRADARGGQDGTVPMSVAIGYGVLVRHAAGG